VKKPSGRGGGYRGHAQAHAERRGEHPHREPRGDGDGRHVDQQASGSFGEHLASRDRCGQGDLQPAAALFSGDRGRADGDRVDGDQRRPEEAHQLDAEVAGRGAQVELAPGGE
jgi:hypothetical protein